MIPSLSVVQTVPSRRRKDGAGALLAAETEAAVQQPRHEPLEPDRHLAQPAAERSRHAVDHGAGDQRLADGGVRAPARAVLEQVPDGHGQVVVRVHQARPRDDAVAVGVGVVAEGDVEPILEADQAGHGVGRGAVHADLAVVVHGHEGEGRVHARVDDLEVEPVALGDGLPEGQARAAHGVHADPEPARADGLHVDHAGEVGDVGLDVVVLARRGGAERRRERDALDLAIPSRQERVGPGLDDRGLVGVRRAAVRRVVLEAAVVGRVVRRRDRPRRRPGPTRGPGCGSGWRGR